MIDYSALPLVVDASHYQGVLDFGTLIADGMKAIILKATQGMTTDPMFSTNRMKAETAGLPWLAYPYLTPDDDATTVANFLSVVGYGAVAALDWEESGVAATVVEMWMDGVEGAPGGRQGLNYYGKWPPAPVTARIGQWPRWLPDYPQDLLLGPNLPMWDGSPVTDWSSRCFLWQFTGNGRLPGISTTIDLSRLSCDVSTFGAWYSTGKLPTHAVTPDPVPDVLLYLHCSGPAVLALQRSLITLGYSAGADGQFGPQTRAAVIQFQASVGLTADGVVGPATRAALNQGVTS